MTSCDAHAFFGDAKPRFVLPGSFRVLGAGLYGFRVGRAQPVGGAEDDGHDQPGSGADRPEGQREPSAATAMVETVITATAVRGWLRRHSRAVRPFEERAGSDRHMAEPGAGGADRLGRQTQRAAIGSRRQGERVREPPVVVPGESPDEELSGPGRQLSEVAAGDVHRHGVVGLRHDSLDLEPVVRAAPDRHSDAPDQQRAEGEHAEERGRYAAQGEEGVRHGRVVELRVAGYDERAACVPRNFAAPRTPFLPVPAEAGRLAAEFERPGTTSPKP
ncbi:hypothetical protein [Streptomyces liangshanensis]|uniref:hypothetical protein n=1 Tax=Streptomyces liangshanensis TaxID=2717324 RepID=UPI0036DE70A6